MRIELHNGDCLDKMKAIADGSVDLVLCDPPYGTMKNIASGEGLDCGMKGRTGWDTAIEPALFLEQCNRVLRLNGALVLFSQEPYTSRLITEAHANLPFSYRMTWLKDHFANALIAKKAPGSYSEDVLVFFKKYDTLAAHPLRDWFNSELEAAGLSYSEVSAVLGNRMASHYFTTGLQFSLPTEPNLLKLQTTGRFMRPHSELKAVDADFKSKMARAFNLPPGKKYKSNVLEYRKDYTGFHPTQKPVALLEDLISTYSNPGDTVLDFTMGSGSTGVACRNTGRDFIGIELDPGYFAIAETRIRSPGAAIPIKAAPPTDQRQLDLLACF